MHADDGLTATAGPALGASDAAELLSVVRWVHPHAGLTVLTAETTVLGRDPALATRLTGEQVSRRHAELRLRAGRVELVDLGSKNGCFVNGTRVTSAALAENDVVRLGDCIGVVERVAPGGLPGFAELSPGLWGGAALRAVVERAKIAAKSSLNIVIVGDTGSGKERFARAIHAWSGRTGPFVAVNCANYTASTAQAELFGYRKGAFTGADRANLGHIRAAHQGTLLLDEMIDLPLDVQAKLLRALEQREVLALGETTPVGVDVQIVAAAQAPLTQAVVNGRFRADLCARLQGIAIQLPPLRERRADVLPLFKELLRAHGFASPPTLDAALAERLCLEPWPLNVRQLENVARRAAAFYAGKPALPESAWAEIAPEDLTEVAHDAESEPRSHANNYSAEEIAALRAALAKNGNNLSKAASELGITRGKAYRMLRSSQ